MNTYEEENNTTAKEQADELREMAALIDSMMDSGVSRLKLKPSEEMQAGEYKKEYHHGRCDLNSPWAKGTAFDVLE